MRHGARVGRLERLRWFPTAQWPGAPGGATAHLLPACSTLSHSPLCAGVPRRVGRCDHLRQHGHQGRRHRRLRASRRLRDRLFKYLSLRHGQLQRSWRLRSSMGGGMAAEVAQQCGGLGQGARTADAGAGGRLRRVFWRRNDAFCECRVRIVHVPKVRLFAVYCTLVRLAHGVLRARLGRAERC